MSIEFNGTTSNIGYGSASDLDDLAVSGAFSIHAWINADGHGEGNTGRIMNKRESETEAGWLFFVDATNSLGFQTIGTGFSVQSHQRGSDDAISLDTWHSIVLTYDDAGDRKAHIYVDGSEISYDTDVAATGTNGTDAGGVLIVGNNGDSGRTFDGELAEAAIWDRVLTAGEISQLAGGLCPSLVSTTGLVLYAPLDDDTVDTQGNSDTPVATSVTTHPPTVYCPLLIANAFGPGPDIGMYVDAPIAFSLVTSPLPPDGGSGNVLQNDSGTGNWSAVCGNTGGQASFGSNMWVMGWFQLGSGGDVDEHFGIIHMSADSGGVSVSMRGKVTSDGFNIGIFGNVVMSNDSPENTEGFTGGFLDDTWYFFIMRTNGTDVRVWVDGTQEAIWVNTRNIDEHDFGFSAHETASPSYKTFWCQWALVHSAFASDVTETTAFSQVLHHLPDGNGTHSDWNRTTACTGTAVYTDVDDWITGADDGQTTIWCAGDPVSVIEQSVTIADQTYADTFVGPAIRVLSRAQGTPKGGADFSILLRESSTDDGITRALNATMRPTDRVVTVPPGGGSWTEAKINASEIGVTRDDDDTDAMEIEVTAMLVEGLAIGSTDPRASSVAPQYATYSRRQRAT